MGAERSGEAGEDVVMDKRDVEEYMTRKTGGSDTARKKQIRINVRLLLPEQNLGQQKGGD